MEQDRLTLEDLTKRRLVEMSDDEVVVWYQTIKQQAQVKGMRKELSDLIEIRDASGPRVIKIDSTVVD